MENAHMEPDPTVFVVDDDPAMRQSLRWLIESVNVGVETYATAQDFLAAYDPDRPGCLVLDVRMPGMGGLDLQAELARREIEVPVIIITGYAEVPTAVRALKSGALDFIEKPFSDQLLLDRIQQAIASDRQARVRRHERAALAARVAQLTPREREVMQLVVAGSSNREIAAELGLSVKTVEVHRARVMEKMKVDSLADLVRLVLSA
jgi:two-component system, LuxR family, response regulator FixJ